MEESNLPEAMEQALDRIRQEIFVLIHRRAVLLGKCRPVEGPPLFVLERAALLLHAWLISQRIEIKSREMILIWGLAYSLRR